jgi:hypothetical protein
LQCRDELVKPVRSKRYLGWAVVTDRHQIVVLAERHPDAVSGALKQNVGLNPWKTKLRLGHLDVNAGWRFPLEVVADSVGVFAQNGTGHLPEELIAKLDRQFGDNLVQAGEVGGYPVVEVIHR